MPCRTGANTHDRHQLEYWDVGRLTATDGNPKKHDPKQVRLIAESIKKFGFINPIIVNKQGKILAGHGRLAAATKAEINTVPVIVVSNLSEVDERAFLLADNQLAQIGGGGTASCSLSSLSSFSRGMRISIWSSLALILVRSKSSSIRTSKRSKT